MDKNWAKRAACKALDRILWGLTRSPRGDRQGPQFAMIRVGGPTGGTIGLLAHDSANPLGSISMTPEQRAGIHVELTTDNLDVLYEHLKARGVVFFEPPHEEPWERSMRAHDPDGYTVEFAEGRRGHRGVT